MSKPVKDILTSEYQRRYASLDSACVVSVIGLDGKSANRLRGELRAKNIRLQVIKNSLARRALAGSRLFPLAEKLSGPCALVTGGDSIIDVAKTLVALKKTYPRLELRMGILEGDPQLIDIERLSAMKGRQEVLAEIAAVLRGPGGRLAGCLVGPAGRIAGCVKAIIDKAEKGEQGAPAAAG